MTWLNSLSPGNDEVEDDIAGKSNNVTDAETRTKNGSRRGIGGERWGDQRGEGKITKIPPL